MPKPKKVPRYRLHKPSGQALVELNGESFYLGRHGTEHSKAKYQYGSLKNHNRLFERFLRLWGMIMFLSSKRGLFYAP